MIARIQLSNRGAHWQQAVINSHCTQGANKASPCESGPAPYAAGAGKSCSMGMRRGIHPWVGSPSPPSLPSSLSTRGRDVRREGGRWCIGRLKFPRKWSACQFRGHLSGRNPGDGWHDHTGQQLTLSFTQGMNVLWWYTLFSRDSPSNNFSPRPGRVIL